MRRWQKGKVFTVTKIRLRTALASRDGTPAPLLHDLRMLGVHAYTLDDDEGPAPPGQQPFEIVVLKIEDKGGKTLQDLISSLQQTVSDWAQARFYQARGNRSKRAPKHLLIRGPSDETLVRLTLRCRGNPGAALAQAA